MSLFSRLFRTLDYLRISHKSKNKYDYYAPGILTIFAIAMYYILPLKPALLGTDGFVAKINGILQMLVGFYIASLAAISTFNKSDMDELMDGTPPTLKDAHSNSLERLTRRRFLSLMFGYLAFLSLFLYFSGISAEWLTNNIKLLCNGNLFRFVKISLLGFYIFCISNLIVTTLIGLYYMSDKIHRIKPKKTKVSREAP